jgi:Flp pilus assembly protein TadD
MEKRMPLVRTLTAFMLAVACSVSLLWEVGAQTQQEDEGIGLYNQSIPFLEAGQWENAARYLYRASQLAPNNYAITYNLGVAFSNLKRHREAWQAFARASAIRPNSAKAAIAVANCYADCGDKKRCVTMLQDVQRRFTLSASEQEHVADLIAEYGDGQAASEQLSSLVKSQPQNVEMHKTLAYSLTKSGKYKEALSEYETCCKLGAPSPGIYQNMMYCHDQLGDLEGLQATRKLYVQKFPTSKNAKTILDEIAYYDKDFAKTRRREADESSERGAFAEMRMPVKVYVHDRLSGRTTWSAKQPQNAKGKINYSLMVERAFDQWTAASGRKLTFLIMDNPQNANIECQWTPDRNKLHYSFAAGVTSYSYNKLNEPKATIFLLTDCDSDNEFLDTSLHEIGHALGLSHSSSPADVMYSSGQTLTSNAAPALSPNDIARMKHLYP